MICGVLGVGRVLLIMFGAKYWLIGTSAAYFVSVTTHLSYSVVPALTCFFVPANRRRFGVVLSIVAAKRMVAASLLEIHDHPSLKYVPQCARGIVCWLVRSSIACGGRVWLCSTLCSPLGVLCLYSIAFAGLLIVVVAKLDGNDGGVPMAEVALFSSNSHAQYIYGLAALLAVRVSLGVYHGKAQHSSFALWSPCHRSCYFLELSVFGASMWLRVASSLHESWCWQPLKKRALLHAACCSMFVCCLPPRTVIACSHRLLPCSCEHRC